MMIRDYKIGNAVMFTSECRVSQVPSYQWPLRYRTCTHRACLGVTECHLTRVWLCYCNIRTNGLTQQLIMHVLAYPVSLYYAMRVAGHYASPQPHALSSPLDQLAAIILTSLPAYNQSLPLFLSLLPSHTHSPHTHSPRATLSRRNTLPAQLSPRATPTRHRPPRQPSRATYSP